MFKVSDAVTTVGSKDCTGFACALDGYHVFEGRCVLNECACENGVGATGAACAVDGDRKCASCEDGYYLFENECLLNVDCGKLPLNYFRNARCDSAQTSNSEAI